MYMVSTMKIIQPHFLNQFYYFLLDLTSIFRSWIAKDVNAISKPNYKRGDNHLSEDCNVLLRYERQTGRHASGCLTQPTWSSLEVSSHNSTDSIIAMSRLALNSSDNSKSLTSHHKLLQSQLHIFFLVTEKKYCVCIQNFSNNLVFHFHWQN